MDTNPGAFRISKLLRCARDVKSPHEDNAGQS
uniref:Uncharacterized protein n=1 Tax=Arundo donax TaxID=35708 RepID=A0A0A9B9M3_ARUDO